MMEKQSRPLIVAMKGHPGTGKSTLARAIAAALTCPLLDKDDIRDCTLPLQLALTSTSTSTSTAVSLLNDLSYSVLWRTAATQLRLGLSVVIDSPLSRRAHLDGLLELARCSGVPAAAGIFVIVIECRPTDAAEWRRRLEERGAAAAGGDGEGWHKPKTWDQLQDLLEGYRGCTEYDFGDIPRLIVDTCSATATVDDIVASVLEFIRINSIAR